MAYSSNDIRTEWEIIEDAIRYSKFTGENQVVFTTECAERMVKLLKDREILMESRNPYRPIYTRTVHGAVKVLCGACRERLSISRKGLFCPYCGHEIDWNGEAIERALKESKDCNQIETNCN